MSFSRTVLAEGSITATLGSHNTLAVLRIAHSKQIYSQLAKSATKTEQRAEMPYYVHATDVACRLRLRRDTIEGAEKKAREFLMENYWDVRIEFPDGHFRDVDLQLTQDDNRGSLL